MLPASGAICSSCKLATGNVFRIVSDQREVTQVGKLALDHHLQGRIHRVVQLRISGMEVAIIQVQRRPIGPRPRTDKLGRGFTRSCRFSPLKPPFDAMVDSREAG